jgi:hypothetical protein
MARCPPTSAEFTVIRIVLREALVSSTRLKKVFARFTAEGAHVPLMVGRSWEESTPARSWSCLRPPRWV